MFWIYYVVDNQSEVISFKLILSQFNQRRFPFLWSLPQYPLSLSYGCREIPCVVFEGIFLFLLLGEWRSKEISRLLHNSRTINRFLFTSLSKIYFIIELSQKLLQKNNFSTWTMSILIPGPRLNSVEHAIQAIQKLILNVALITLTVTNILSSSCSHNHAHWNF